MCAAIKPRVLHGLRESTSRRVREVVGRDASERSPNQKSWKTVVAKKIAVCEDAGKQQRDIAFDYDQKENAVQSVSFDDVRQKLKAVHKNSRQKAISRRQRDLCR
jgi:hypothetical protein